MFTNSMFAVLPAEQTVSHILEGGVGFHPRHVDNTEAFNSVSADF